MKVLFRKDKETKEIVAFLPESNVRYGNIQAYVHNGQHFEADYLYYMQGTEKATSEEYRSLLNELQSIYDNELVVRKRIYHHDVMESWK